jgi:hypothetical protein
MLRTENSEHSITELLEPTHHHKLLSVLMENLPALEVIVSC